MSQKNVNKSTAVLNVVLLLYLYLKVLLKYLRYLQNNAEYCWKYCNIPYQGTIEVPLQVPLHTFEITF